MGPKISKAVNGRRPGRHKNPRTVRFFYFPAQKACFPKAASESPAVHPTNDKTRRFVPGGKAPFELMSAGRDHSADCLVMAQLILTRLSAITPRPTQRCIPASPL